MIRIIVERFRKAFRVVVYENKWKKNWGGGVAEAARSTFMPGQKSQTAKERLGQNASV